MRRLFALLAVLCLLGPAHAQFDLSALQGECLGDFLADQPPVIHQVKYSKEAKAGEEIVIEITAHNDEEISDSETETVTVYYSTDGGKTYQSVEAEGVGEDTPIKQWKATIPAQEAGRKIKFYVSAVDDTGNVATEVAGTPSGFPPDASAFPAGKEDEDCGIGPDFDILGLSLTADDNTVYGKLKIKGKFGPGTLSPPKIHGYIIGLIEPKLGIMDVVNLFSGAGSAQLNGGIFFWAPHAKTIGGEIVGITKDALLIVSGSSTIMGQQAPVKLVQDGVESKMEGDTLYFSFPRKELGKKMEAYKAAGIAAFLKVSDASSLMSMFGGGGGGDFLSILGTDIDFALYLTTYFRNHEITVK